MSGKTYRTWNGDLFYHICEDGKISRGVGGGLREFEIQYQGKGKPYACQAVNQRLLLGKESGEHPVLFGISEINHGYADYSGDIFSDYDIDIIKGTKEQVEKIFDKCVIPCEECCHCGDW